MNLAELFHLYKIHPSDINQHLQFMHDVCVETGARTVIELGVRTGVSTAAFLTAMHATDGRVWSCDIDPPQTHPVISEDDRWEFVWASDLDVVDEAPDCDVLFIDTSHAYQHTLDELDAYAPKTAKVILLHDTQLEQPEGLTDQLPFPVRQAVIEWHASHPEWSFEEFTHCWGLGVLRRI